MRYLLLPVLLMSLSGCDKVLDDNEDDCNNNQVPQVSVNTNVQAGSNINLTVASIRGAEYYLWTGPNGYTSNDQNPEIRNAQINHAGRYKVEVGVTGGCRLSASTDSVIISIPPAPCSPGTNVAQLSGVSSMNFTWVTGAPSGGSYFIEGNSSGGDVELEFPGTDRPLPGMYTIQPLGGQWLAGDVRLRAVASSSNWPAAAGKVYVTVNNNKATVTFCNIEVRSQTFTFTTRITGSLTER